MSLSKKLRELLFERNITPTELAKKSGVPAPTVHRMVTGKTQHPKEKSLEAISEFLGVNVVDLTNSNTEIIKSNEVEFKKIPILSWENLDIEIKDLTTNEYIIVNNVSDSAFALQMLDHSMKPFVEKGALLVLDPTLKATDRSYCLIKVNNLNTFVLRQVLIDMDHIFIKSINKDIGEKSIRLLTNKDVILARLVEMRVKIE